MKHLRKLTSIFLFVLLSIIGISQSNYSVRISSQNQKIRNISIISYVDCYTYERIFENGHWWIYVYDCDGNFIEMILDDDD